MAAWVAKAGLGVAEFQMLVDLVGPAPFPIVFGRIDGLADFCFYLQQQGLNLWKPGQFKTRTNGGSEKLEGKAAVFHGASFLSGRSRAKHSANSGEIRCFFRGIGRRRGGQDSDAVGTPSRQIVSLRCS